MSKVNTQMGGGKGFDTKSGVRQCSILSPLLFILYMNLVIKEVHGINDNGKQFILAYADVIAQTAATKEELEKCMTTWNTAFTKYQLKLNLMKTEVMVINRTPPQVRITLHDIEIKQVEIFKYLGCNVNANGTIEEAINRRTAKYSQHVGMMYRLVKDRNVPHKEKLVIHKTKLRSMLLHGHKSWVTTKILDNRIQAAYMTVLRLIKGVTRRDYIRNVDIYREFHIKAILDVIREGTFRWLGHVMRREPHSMLHEVVNYKVKGTRPRRRPRTTWQKSLDNQLKEK